MNEHGQQSAPGARDNDGSEKPTASRRAADDRDVHDEREVPVAQGPVEDLPALSDAAPSEPSLSALPRSPAHDVLEALSKDELIDRHLRLVADHRRLRQRSEEEQGQARQSERDRVLLSFLDVLDTLERGLQASEGEENPWREGMHGLQKQMLDVLGRYGVTPFTPLGERFDAHEHEALSMMPDERKRDGEVAYVERNGYREGARVLRPARVVVVRNA